MHLENEKNCQIIYLCPTVPKESCNWEGNAIDMLEHVLYAHQELLLDTNSFSVDISEYGNKSYIIPTDNGLFLVQIKTNVDEMIIHIQLRFLSYDNSSTNFLRYGVEVSCNSIGFTNENTSENYNPVYNTNNGVDIDLKTIALIIGYQAQQVPIKINLYRNFKEPIVCLSAKDLKPDEDELCVTTNLCNLSLISEDEEENEHPSFEPDSFLNDTNECVGGKEEKEDLLPKELLQCVNCKCNMIPPIHVCPNEHNVCYSCRSSICSVCNEAITSNRNFYLEDYSKMLKHRCRFEPQGCSELCSYNEIRKHELRCVCCIYKCEICSFEGKLAEIGTHFRIAHPSTKIYETMSGIHFRKGSNFIILNSFGVFYCTSSATDIYIKWEVIYCGPKERFFSCEVKVGSKKQNQSTKNYFLRRSENVYRWTVSWNELKHANVKEKYAMLYVSSY